MNSAPELYRALWRQRFLILLLTVVATVTAYVQSANQEKVYRASSLVRVEQPVASTDPQQAGDALGVAQQLTRTYAQIVSTRAIADQVYSYLGSKGPRNEINLSGSPVQDLELMYINSQSHIPALAAAAANAAPAVLRNFITSTGGVRDRIVTINPATVPTSASSPRPARTALLALLVALVFNCGFALLFEFVRDRLPDVDQLEETLGQPVLATIPKLALKPGGVRARSSSRPFGTLAPRPAREKA
jgi:capsular polysaccharide biosynthesis protein